jgi:chemosensory pili system protein ChpA (sensor histidine kinase/response regulator)
MSKIKVMLVDDYQPFLRQTKLGLEDFGEFEVITESNSDRAAAILQDPTQWVRGYPDIFLLDIVMPGIMGGELAQIIRDQPQLKERPIVFYTASDAIVTREEVVKAGGRIGQEDFLTKGNTGLDELRSLILKRVARRT